MRNEDNVTGIAFMGAILMPIDSWELFPPDVRKIFQNFRTPDMGWDKSDKSEGTITRLVNASVSY
jgi:hypothetical protein